jgi:hypothetical protein
MFAFDGLVHGCDAVGVPRIDVSAPGQEGGHAVGISASGRPMEQSDAARIRRQRIDAGGQQADNLDTPTPKMIYLQVIHFKVSFMIKYSSKIN